MIHEAIYADDFALTVPQILQEPADIRWHQARMQIKNHDLGIDVLDLLPDCIEQIFRNSQKMMLKLTQIGALNRISLNQKVCMGAKVLT
ncbi:MAG: hypothetical protein A3H35_11910 [Betaproteobacteria bacterium RIFCSPLOWO2_02_FULL_62_17]|nr:MAG: hypothetical protein A3H35_11910 [Betaproteobacteria bacterium RIFCSPLOWO2_02_FULL_62_17]